MARACHPPGALGQADQDIPTITPYLPSNEQVSGTAIVVCPGGGYGGLAGHEGEGYAVWLAQNGVSAFVLKYRLGSKGYRHPVMLGDVSRAIRLVRSHAAEWKLDPQRVSVMGSSAGGQSGPGLEFAPIRFRVGKVRSDLRLPRLSKRPARHWTERGKKWSLGRRNSSLGQRPAVLDAAEQLAEVSVSES